MTAVPPPASDVDALRDKLRALGYLDAGVDRFVLGPARAGRSVRAVALGASLRIGLLAGLLLGVSSAMAIAVRLPQLVTGARDALVIAVALGLLFGSAVAGAAFVAVLVAGRVVRGGSHGPAFPARGRRAAWLAGLLVGGACLTYLTLWWRLTGPTASGGAALGTTGIALLVAVGISLLLGHTTATTARAVTAIDAGSDAAAQALARAPWWSSALLAAAAFAAAGVLLYATSRSGDRAGPAATRLVVVPTGTRLTVLAIDGFDGLFAARHVRPEGALARLLGGRRRPLAPPGEADPVRVWTLIATGQPAERHGVTALEQRRVAGLSGRVNAPTTGLAANLAAAADLLRLTRPAIATGAERRVPAFWEVAARAGLRTCAVNWWVTWPADPADGTVITDRALVRLERGGTADREVGPPALFDRLKADWPSLRAGAEAAVGSAFEDLPPDIASALARSARVDAQVMALAAAATAADTDLSAVYLPGLDIAQHALLTDAWSPAGLQARLDGLARYYRVLDVLIDGFARRPGSVMLVGYPGRVRAGTGGVVAVVGAGDLSPPGARPTPALHVADIAPTVLDALGVPISRELTGKVARELFPAAFAARHETRYVASYGRRDVPASATTGATDLDEEVRERLRSLGYVR